MGDWVRCYPIRATRGGRKAGGLVKGDPPSRAFAGISDSRREAQEAAEKARPGFAVQWGSYDERDSEFVRGNSP